MTEKSVKPRNQQKHHHHHHHHSDIDHHVPENTISLGSSSTPLRNQEASRRSKHSSARHQSRGTSSKPVVEEKKEKKEKYRTSPPYLKKSPLYSSSSSSSHISKPQTRQREANKSQRTTPQTLGKKKSTKQTPVGLDGLSETGSDMTQTIKQRTVELAKSVGQRKVVEVPEIEYVDKFLEVPSGNIVRKVVEVPKVEYVDRQVIVPKVMTRERVVEVPEIEYRIVHIPSYVEVPEIREEVVVKEVKVPYYVEKPTPEYVDVEDPVDITRHIPEPCEAVKSFHFQMKKLVPQFNVVSVPVHVPRFIEIPFPVELVDAPLQDQISALQEGARQLGGHHAPSLQDMERLAAVAKDPELVGRLNNGLKSMSQAFSELWAKGNLSLEIGKRQHNCDKIFQPNQSQLIIPQTPQPFGSKVGFGNNPIVGKQAFQKSISRAS